MKYGAQIIVFLGAVFCRQTGGYVIAVDGYGAFSNEGVSDGEHNEESVNEYHFPMLNDKVRNGAFYDALRGVITNDSRVLDIGAGTALLSMMSSKLGAELATAIEKNTVLAKVGREILELNGFSDDKIRLFQGQSYDVEVGSFHLPQPANVLVSETLDSWVIEEGFLVSLHDAKVRGLITQDATIIPNRATLFCQMVETRYSIASIPAMVECFNLEPLRKHRRQDHNFVVELTSEVVHKNLSEPMAVFDFSFQNFDTKTGLFNYTHLEFPVIADGNFHALAFWFDVVLDKEGKITLSNRPGGGTHWMQMLKMMPEDYAVRAGDTQHIQMSHTGEKYQIGNAQHNSRLIHVKSSCFLPVEIFSSPPPAAVDEGVTEELFVTTLQGVDNEFEVDHNVFHGYFGQTFSAYIPSSIYYNTKSPLNKKREFVIPKEDEGGEIKMYEFYVECLDEPHRL